MTKKDYIAAAKIFREFYNQLDSVDPKKDVHFGGMTAIKFLADEFALMFGRDNPAFNHQKFIEACGINPRSTK